MPWPSLPQPIRTRSDPFGRELLAYPRHPVGRGNVTTPHLHLASHVRPFALDDDPVAVTEVRIPAGPMRLANAVRLPIGELDVIPRRPP